MSNIGQLLHKLTKYQSLYGFVADDGKKALYSQKIAYYKQQLQQAGIDQNNINDVQNLVGGEAYDTKDILAKLFPEQPSKSDDYKKRETEINKAIDNAEKSIKEIEQNYDNTIETVKKIINDIENKISTHGTQPAASVLPDILKKIKILETQLSKLKEHTSKEKFSDNIKPVAKGAQGAQGAQGAKGSKGGKGARGAQVAQRAQGAQVELVSTEAQKEEKLGGIEETSFQG
jgi:uncharacterized membrane-anchored protein YhcB (DUF1043 family)